MVMRCRIGCPWAPCRPIDYNYMVEHVEGKGRAMNIRRAEERDIERIGELLLQVCQVHADRRPDLFRAGGRKYTADELKAMLQDYERPIFVAEDDEAGVCGYAFCQHIRHVDSPSLVDIHTHGNSGADFSDVARSFESEINNARIADAACSSFSRMYPKTVSACPADNVF